MIIKITTTNSILTLIISLGPLFFPLHLFQSLLLSVIRSLSPLLFCCLHASFCLFHLFSVFCFLVLPPYCSSSSALCPWPPVDHARNRYCATHPLSPQPARHVQPSHSYLHNISSTTARPLSACCSS